MNHPAPAPQDLSGLEREYDNRGKVTPAQLQAYRARWAQGSDQARTGLLIAADIAYGRDAAETADVYGKVTSELKPVHLYIHGGYWHFGDKADSAYVAMAFPDTAITVVMNYGLAPAYSLRQQLAQCHAAVAWIWKCIERFGGDPHRIIVTGHSAGAHLAAMLLTADWLAFDSTLPAQPIGGCALLSGIYDLAPIGRLAMNRTLGLTPADIDALSPIRHPLRGDPQVFIAVGEKEGTEYLGQSTRLAWRWSDTTRIIRCKVIADADHFSIRSDWERPGHPVMAALQAMMGSNGYPPLVN